MNLPNKITLARVVLIPFILAFLLMIDEPRALELTEESAGRLNPGLLSFAWFMALLLFIVAAVTDAIDGIIARRWNLITDFGRLMDPLADKLLVAACFIAFVEKELLPAWMVIIILFREFLVTGLRSLAAEKGKIICADRWGKSKTITQMVTIICTMLLMSLRYFLLWLEQWEALVRWSGPVDAYIYYLIYVLGLACVILSVGSGGMYMLRNRDIFKDN